MPNYLIFLILNTLFFNILVKFQSLGLWTLQGVSVRFLSGVSFRGRLAHWEARGSILGEMSNISRVNWYF